MKNFKPAAGRPTEINKRNHRRNLMKLLLLVGISIAFAISACDFRTADSAMQTNSKKENNMESIQSASIIQHKKPPIDTTVASETETATFALG
jgi:hypothetical protein